MLMDVHKFLVDMQPKQKNEIDPKSAFRAMFENGDFTEVFSDEDSKIIGRKEHLEKQLEQLGGTVIETQNRDQSALETVHLDIRTLEQ